jgi:hypothetical protein
MLSEDRAAAVLETVVPTGPRSELVLPCCDEGSAPAELSRPARSCFGTIVLTAGLAVIQLTLLSRAGSSEAYADSRARHSRARARPSGRRRVALMNGDSLSRTNLVAIWRIAKGTRRTR